jgi:L-alanine-DL-glutamate epimerase-like enolase superfamily enzyme
MKISKIETWSVNLKLAEPYTIAYDSFDSVVNIFLRIETDQGIIGYGCAAPDEHVTSETPESNFQAIRDIVSPLLRSADPFRSSKLMEDLKIQISSQPSVLAAVDMALYDILGKFTGLPVWKMLGGFRDRMMTSITIGILPERETVERAKEWIAQGFKCLKLKGGNDVECDVARVIRTRESIGDNIKIRFDANQGYTIDQTVHFVKKTERANLEFIEQPTPNDDPDALNYLTTHISLPVMADESVLNLYDAFRLVRFKAAKLMNVKLMKVGGISEALQIDAVARSAGVEVMAGCMDESALSIAAGLHFALARPNVIYADLDGHIGLLNDPFANGVILRDGILFPSDKPGLGCELTD